VSYDVIARFDAVAPARAAEVVLHTTGMREDGRDRWVLDAFADGGARFFSVEALEKTWLGKPRALRLSLPFGGSAAEARVFADAVQAIAFRLKAVVTDATGALTPGSEAEVALARWRAANLAALAIWEVGFVVRPGNATGCGRTACPEVAPQADGPLTVTSLVSAYLRMDALDEARAAVSRAIDRLGATFELGRLLATVDQRRADPTGARARAKDLVESVLMRDRLDDEHDEHEDYDDELDYVDEDERRRDAVEDLVALGVHAVRPLVDALTRGGDEDGHAAAALLQVGAPAVPALLEAFASTSGDARFAVTHVLEQLREPTLAHAAAWVRVGAEPGEVADLVDLLERLEPDAATAEALADRLIREPDVPGVELEGFLTAALRTDPTSITSVLRLLREGSGDQVEHAARATARSSWTEEALHVLLERILSQPAPYVDEGDPIDPPALSGGLTLSALVDVAMDLGSERTLRTLKVARSAPDELRRARALEALRLLGEDADEEADEDADEDEDP
jgi:hypothetical protein